MQAPPIALLIGALFGIAVGVQLTFFHRYVIRRTIESDRAMADFVERSPWFTIATGLICVATGMLLLLASVVAILQDG